MAQVKRYIGSNGEILLPLNQNAENTANLVSVSGVFYLAVTEAEAVPIEAGMPMGLLLSITYPAAP